MTAILLLLNALWALVAHDPKTGKTTHPVYRDTDGTFPYDPQINAADREVGTKPTARHSGYVKGGTTNPSLGEPSEPTYYDPAGKEVSPDVVLDEPWRPDGPKGVGGTRASKSTGDLPKESAGKDEPVDLPVGAQPAGSTRTAEVPKGRRDVAAEETAAEEEAAKNAAKAAASAKKDK